MTKGVYTLSTSEKTIDAWSLFLSMFKPGDSVVIIKDDDRLRGGRTEPTVSTMLEDKEKKFTRSPLVMTCYEV